ncbi:glucose/mannose transport system permease protein [Cellulosimicrobium cellulans]|jgi:glucose/mannose transport system permease protein|uniref:Sugar ABC transporter permease n=1 Tax=Cellulosimicrobium cellulans TaxID=1710 RepID=A0A1Y0HXJ9_CELCE|nr:sugar ABC transporter permease [Cellulosimicrobium cellulans]ARU51873.1 sugar ABC transporter permease [Cellulosimicrobium cellulans]MBM7818379.1 glucose/mannose transport system permease protein [Cellulosimicrobium cellulans]
MLKSLRRAGPALLMLAPSLILVGVFVYGLIGANFTTSITDNHTAAQATGQKPSVVVWFENYFDLLGSEAFQHSLKNLVLYTVVFLAGTLVMGFLWAWMMDKPVKGEGLFRSVYLFPFAVSFVASGVVWRWLLNSNQDAQASGLNRLFQIIGLDFLQNNWWNNVTWGITAIAIPAIWQLSGYVMALFLAGFRGIPDELREAARMDGASEWKLYRHVLFPQLSPVALSALIIIGHMSLKSFDLIMSISKPANYQTKVPAVDMYVFKSSFDYANAAAVGSILLIIVAVVIVPYLVRTNRQEKR